MKIIAEIGPANGSVDYAIAAAEAASRAGAWAVKGQMYRRETLTSRTAATYAQGLTRVPATQWEDFADTIPYKDWRHVKDACDGLGIVFFASVFDFDAVDACEAIGVGHYKIASGDITYQQLLLEVGATGKQVFVSTGAATIDEYRRAAEWIGHDRVIPFVCTLAYPTTYNEAHLDRIRYWSSTGQQVGWSDHTPGIAALIVAREMGAVVAEKHFTITPLAGGDHDFAVTPKELEDFTTGNYAPVSGRDFDILAGSYYLTPRSVEEPARVGARRSTSSPPTRSHVCVPAEVFRPS